MKLNWQCFSFYKVIMSNITVRWEGYEMETTLAPLSASIDYKEVLQVFRNDSITDDNLTCDQFLPPGSVLATVWFQTTIYCLYCTIFVVALVGNALVCYVVWNSPRMKTVTNFFIVNLAFGDILLTLFCVPTSFVSTLILQYWPFGPEMCPSVNYSQVRIMCLLRLYNCNLIYK